ncbi:hypothetical protein Tsubulata_014958 [Turnera subulata]|uniref:MBD domain-containing protein n=1 Tax=Turnera subulata TaxID=218843 RepID=A0A9Q0F9L1_9ROSI|nr:hypothetical protein Tsubulata_014958 [Turnera subulata]
MEPNPARPNTEDPLLPRGSHIESTATGDDKSFTKGKSAKPKPKPTQSNSTNGSESTAQTRPRRSVLPNAESLTWLPSGWEVEDRVRSSGATAGSVDRYYFEPSTGRKFRSKKEVLHYLETGSLKKRKKDSIGDNNSSDSSSTQPSKPDDASMKPPEVKFDFNNVPDTVEWVLSEAKTDVWTPSVDGQSVPENARRGWTATFSSVTSKMPL